MDLNKITKELKKFIRKHKSKFEEIPKRETAILEIGALATTAEYYKNNGYLVSTKNLKNGNFKVKMGARGNPYNFSWFTCEKDNIKFEIHSNLSVYDGYNENGVYVVDVGICNSKKVEELSSLDKGVIKAIKNKDLITFIEVKKLVVYPMLLAQFVGIVHELQPFFLKGKLPDNFEKKKHFYPTLIATQYLSGTTSKIIDDFKKRNYKISIIWNFENRIFDLNLTGRNLFSNERSDLEIDIS
ncbi:MAG: hypothetical protein N4A44_04450 [Alphaproteobacteria bacterium]|jgi:hypothetical protein|nr:hypothetical protein [Alphaproteobacteria bacterium]